jgi:hypothetical protein
VRERTRSPAGKTGSTTTTRKSSSFFMAMRSLHASQSPATRSVRHCRHHWWYNAWGGGPCADTVGKGRRQCGSSA